MSSLEDDTSLENLSFFLPLLLWRIPRWFSQGEQWTLWEPLPKVPVLCWSSQMMFKCSYAAISFELFVQT